MANQKHGNGNLNFIARKIEYVAGIFFIGLQYLSVPTILCVNDLALIYVFESLMFRSVELMVQIEIILFNSDVLNANIYLRIGAIVVR